MKPDDTIKPQGSNNPNDKQLTSQNQAAINISRSQVERIYNGNSEYNTPHTTPIEVRHSQQTQAQIPSSQNMPSDNRILEKTKTIDPLPKSSVTHNNSVGAVNYKPTHKYAASNPRQKQTVQQNAQSEQWKKYHSAWQDYYQKYYESYYSAAVKNIKLKTPSEAAKPVVLSDEDKKAKALYDLKKNISEKAKENTTKFRKSKHFIPVLSASLIVLIFLFLQYNPLLIANVQAYVSPGNAKSQDIIYSPSASVKVGNDPKLIIPKINVDVPVAYGVGNDQDSQQAAMTNGVAHFSIPGAESVPGQIGNTVLSGHSSNNLFDKGDYKFIFAQLDKLDEGDIFYANYEGVRYTYSVTKKEVVSPTNVGSLVYTTDKPVMTLITCTPLGTSENRLLVTAEQISPDISTAKPKQESATGSKQSSQMPSNSPSFFERLFTWNWS